MVFNEASVFIVVLIGISIWVTILSVMVFRMVSHYNNLTKGITGVTMKDVLSLLMKHQEAQGKEILSLRQMIEWLQKDGALHMQRVGIVRFNPFSDTGGSQSFSIALLDGKDNGIVMTSLYARTGNRWYIKHIKNATCEDVELSKEEQLSIKKARPIN